MSLPVNKYESPRTLIVALTTDLTEDDLLQACLKNNLTVEVYSPGYYKITGQNLMDFYNLGATLGEHWIRTR